MAFKIILSFIIAGLKLFLLNILLIILYFFTNLLGNKETFLMMIICTLMNGIIYLLSFLLFYFPLIIRIGNRIRCIKAEKIIEYNLPIFLLPVTTLLILIFHRGLPLNSFLQAIIFNSLIVPQAGLLLFITTYKKNIWKRN